MVKTGEYSDIYTVTRTLSDAERAIIQRGVNEGYETFTKKAADARGMTQENLKRIASGRVWSGDQAVKNGLVDRLGGFNDAVELAVKAAEIEDDYALLYYPEQKPVIEEFFDKMNAKFQVSLFGMESDMVTSHLKELQQLEGLQARLPGNLTIE